MIRNIVSSIIFTVLSLSVVSAQVFAEEQDAEEQAPTEWLVIHAGTLLAIPGDRPKGPSTIVVKNNRIEQVVAGFVEAEKLISNAAPEHLRVLDLRDQFVMPGLIDMHVHLSFDPDKEEPPQYGTSEHFVHEHEDVRNDSYDLITAIENADKTLQAGFTTVRNIGSYGWHIYALRDAINDGKLTGPRIYTAGYIIRVGADSGAGACTGVESCRRATRTQIDMGADLIKVYATCSGGKLCGTQDAPAVFLQDEIQAVIETATSRNLKVAAHAHGSAGVRLAAASGVASIEHGSYNDEEGRALMAENGVFLVPTLSVGDLIREQVLTAKEPMLGVMQGFIDNHGPRMLKAYQSGVLIAAGSDAGIVPHGNGARELEIYVELGLPPEDAIVAATVNAAELLGQSANLGTIEPGKLADLVAVAMNPLDDISALKSISAVIKDGKVVRETP
jgi:imidazolonepropionase-like amidohydrolase